MMPSSVSCIQTSILLHSKHAYSAPQRCWRGKGSFRHKKPCNKTRLSPPPLHFAACWWPSTQASLGPRSRPQTPGILLSLPLLSRFDPHFQGKRQFEKKNGFEWNKTPSPPNPRHYGAVTLGGEGGKEHFGGATFGGAAVGRLGMSVLRDATYATLGARASLRALDPPHRTLSSHMTGLRAPHARTSAHAFACLGAAEAVPSLLLSLLAFAGRIQGLACETGLFRGVFRGCRFFIIF